MKRFDDVLMRQKNALVFDVILAILLVLSIGMTALGVAKTWAASSGWKDASNPVLTASNTDTHDQQLYPPAI